MEGGGRRGGDKNAGTEETRLSYRAQQAAVIQEALREIWVFTGSTFTQLAIRLKLYILQAAQLSLINTHLSWHREHKACMRCPGPLYEVPRNAVCCRVPVETGHSGCICERALRPVVLVSMYIEMHVTWTYTFYKSLGCITIERSHTSWSMQCPGIL